jgi:hypothetical protein
MKNCSRKANTIFVWTHGCHARPGHCLRDSPVFWTHWPLLGALSADRRILRDPAERVPVGASDTINMFEGIRTIDLEDDIVDWPQGSASRASSARQAGRPRFLSAGLKRWYEGREERARSLPSFLCTGPLKGFPLRSDWSSALRFHRGDEIGRPARSLEVDGPSKSGIEVRGGNLAHANADLLVIYGQLDCL